MWCCSALRHRGQEAQKREIGMDLVMAGTEALREAGVGRGELELYLLALVVWVGDTTDRSC